MPRVSADSFLRLWRVLYSNCQTVSQDRCLDTMATGNSPPGSDRTEIDFQVNVHIPWKAPEAYVMLDSPGLFMLDTAHIPDVLGLQTWYPEATPVKVMKGRAPESCSRILLCDACRYAGCGCACVTYDGLEYSTASVAAVSGIRNVSETKRL